MFSLGVIVVVVFCSCVASSNATKSDWRRQADVKSKHQWMLKQNLSTIYLVSSCHLDVGFSDTAVNVVNHYFDDFFPNATLTAKTLRDAGKKERLVFTTHSYLVSLYLDCPPNMGLHCPSEEAQSKFRNAVLQGDITWHAFPFNSEPEYLLKPLMVETGFNLTHRLDDMFGRPHTITMSQRDVPGMTSAIIPIMAHAGVKAVTVGVNGASMPPAVPTVFQWQHNASNTRVLAMWHPGGYGGSNGVSLDSMVVVPGMSHALAFTIRIDNTGPPSITEIIKNYATLKGWFPNADVVASGYDPFVLELMQYQDKLPVVSGEIGDTWIYGTASDPWKTQQFYVILNTWEQSLRSSPALYLDDDRIHNFSRLLIKNGEHTWGKAVVKYLHDWVNWDNEAFVANLHTKPFQGMIASWKEQRTWGIEYALDALRGHPLLTDIQSELDAVHFNGVISTAGYSLEPNPSSVFSLSVKNGTIKIQFDVASGSIVMFSDSRLSAESIANSSHPIAQVVYQTFDKQAYDAFLKQYLYLDAVWAHQDFGKYGMHVSTTQMALPSIKALYSKLNQTSMEYRFLLKMAFNKSSLVTDFGAPQALWLEVLVGSDDNQLNLVLYVVNKTATRLPESLSLYFDPPIKDDARMFVTKLGSPLDVESVIRNGSQHLHSSQAVHYHSLSSTRKITIESVDTSLVCVGFPNPFPTPSSLPVKDEGFSYNIFNNIWGTNYIMWYPFVPEDKCAKFRFKFNYS